MLLRECGPRGAPVGWPERNSAEHVVPPAARGASHTAGELRAAWRGCGVVLPSGAASAAASPPRPEGGGTAGARADGGGGGAAAGRGPAAASSGGKQHHAQCRVGVAGAAEAAGGLCSVTIMNAPAAVWEARRVSRPASSAGGRLYM